MCTACTAARVVPHLTTLLYKAQASAYLLSAVTSAATTPSEGAELCTKQGAVQQLLTAAALRARCKFSTFNTASVHVRKFDPGCTLACVQRCPGARSPGSAPSTWLRKHVHVWRVRARAALWYETICFEHLSPVRRDFACGAAFSFKCAPHAPPVPVPSAVPRAVNNKVYDVVGLSNLCVDVVIPVPQLPPRDTDARRALLDSLAAEPPCESAMEVGGNCNFMIAAARLCMAVGSVGHVGDDVPGAFMNRVLQARGALKLLPARPVLPQLLALLTHRPSACMCAPQHPTG